MDYLKGGNYEGLHRRGLRLRFKLKTPILKLGGGDELSPLFG